MIETCRYRDDVRNRIKGPNFVEVDVVQRCIVNSCLGEANSSEDPQYDILCPLRQCASRDPLDDSTVRFVVVRVLVVGLVPRIVLGARFHVPSPIKHDVTMFVSVIVATHIRSMNGSECHIELGRMDLTSGHRPH